MNVRINHQNNIVVDVEHEDACYTCEQTSECPLINALSSEVVIMRYECIEIPSCSHYRGILQRKNDCGKR